MAKGTLVFEFFSALDLENQMRAYLRLPQLKEVALGELETEIAKRSVLGKPGEGMTVAKTASGIEEEVRKFNAEAAAAHMAAVAAEAVAPVVDKMAKIVAAPPEPPATQEQPAPISAPTTPVEQVQTAAPATQSGPVVETVTLETVETVPYEELLAFCERNPVTGMDVTKCKPSFFRKLVEMRVKAYLETK